MNFHENTLWQHSYVALMDIYQAIDDVEEDVKDQEEETIEGVLTAAQAVAAKIADGLSRIDKRIGKGLLYDSIGLVAVVRTQLAISWGRGLLDDETFKAIDGKYQELATALQK